ncbi:tyrosine-type recombinase/integrase [Bacillus cereus group sp. BfR-BA-01349]|uniref:tyrosine-type recombinase/integrase n=1 Tax=Bacillus cereus group sp. BfR-BA-01349 TaxID=2920312 RepID=UPI001F5A6F8B
MSIEWVEVDHLLVSDEKSKELKPALKLILIELKKVFINGENWLNTPLYKKQTIEKRRYKDIHYLIPWSYHQGIFTNPKYSLDLKEYFFGGRFSKVGGTFTRYALAYGLLTKKEIEKIKELYEWTVAIAYISFASVYCFFINKPFSEMTDEDFDREDLHWVYCLNKNGLVSRIGIQNIRLQLEYSNRVFSIKRPSLTIFQKLKNNYTEYKCVLEDYYKYLIASGLKPKTVYEKFAKLKWLFEYLEMNNISLLNFRNKDFSMINQSMELKGFGVSYRMKILSNIRLFLEWGTLIYECFPTKVEFPKQLFKNLSKTWEKELIEGDGKAFPIEGLEKKIMNIVFNFEPQSEIEELCKEFWLIAGSCPTRFEFIRNLSVDCINPMLNNNTLYGLTSEYEDKGGNVYGEFPIFDRIGIEAVLRLQKRIEGSGFLPIENPRNRLKYVHLFQLGKAPFILSGYLIRTFLHEKILLNIPEIESYINEGNEKFEIGSHGFRHYIATTVMVKTRDIKAVQYILGHHDVTMTKLYLRSKVSKNTLLYSILDGYEKKELSGKFYLSLIDILFNEELTNYEMLNALSTQMEVNLFLKQFGRKRDMGWCMTEESCDNFYRCWSCEHFLLRKEEIEEAIDKLAKHIIEHKKLINESRDFKYNNPIATDSIKKIALIQKRIMDLGLKPEKIWQMVQNTLLGKDIKEVLKDV